MSKTPLPTGTVTFLFSDIEDSTELLRALGNEIFDGVRGRHRRHLRDAFAAHGGHEIDTAGDGFFVAFDSAREAVEAAIEGQLALASEDWPDDIAFRVRMGLHTAEPHLGEEGYVGVGVHRAARICDAGRGGQILLSNATAGIVEDAELPGVRLVDLGEHRLKGLHVAQRLFQLTAPGLEAQFDGLRTADASTEPSAGTFVWTDVSGFGRVIRTVGDEASSALIASYHSAAVAIVAAHGGSVLELAGDTTLAVFRSPSEALRAAPAFHAAVLQIAWPDECGVDLRVAVHSGRWSGNPRQPRAATALQRLGLLVRTVEPGQTLVSATTAGLVEGDRTTPGLRSLGERAFPELGEPMQLYELVEP